ncbi:helix-turn-helix transcriptional regulator [Nocardia sp. NPDC005998]|uniref:AraC family transcriptional regulator n=1 Tax=Nocardia sp. NPDC005998 TaxID=3156894 RepID=UPI0033AA578C
MVKSGQLDTATGIAEFGFSNPNHPQAGIEVLTYTQLTSRLPARMLSAVHRTDFHQIFLITAGTGVIMIDFVEHPCTPGKLFQISPGRVLRLPRTTDPSSAFEPLEALVVLFTPAFPPAMETTGQLLSPFGPVAWTLVPPDRDSLSHTATELLTEYNRAIHDRQAVEATGALLRHLLGVLLLRLARLPAPDSTPSVHGVRREVFERFQYELERSFATTRNAAEHAARLGYSLRSLNRACTAATGHTAKALIDARVALEAKRLLAHTDLPVATIGRRLGFSEPTNFGKFFSRETGYSPGEFRARGRA